MNNIEVPSIPLSSFDASEICKNFEEESAGNDPESNEYLLKNEDSDDTDDDHCTEIELILIGMGMEKYIELFENQNILLDTFLELNETDLREIGITDPKDIEIIVENLSIHQKLKNECTIAENPNEDVRIMKNISRHLLLLQDYCVYAELQMKKYKFTDYKITTEESACTYLKAFTETALVQSQKICDTIYEEDFKYFIDRISEVYNLVLPENFQESLPKRKRKFCVYKLLAVLGFSSLFLLTGKYIVRRWELL